MMVQVLSAIAIIIALGFIINLAYDYKDLKTDSDNSMAEVLFDEQGFCDISLENLMETNSYSENKDIESLRLKIESINNRNKFYKM
ncbi:MAG: hypothetical protein WBB24_18240 [Maribacter sp.]